MICPDPVLRQPVRYNVLLLIYLFPLPPLLSHREPPPSTNIHAHTHRQLKNKTLIFLKWKHIFNPLSIFVWCVGAIFKTLLICFDNMNEGNLFLLFQRHFLFFILEMMKEPLNYDFSTVEDSSQPMHLFTEVSIHF